MINANGSTLTVLKNLLRDNFGDTFNSYYEDDPITIPKASLPCVIIEKIKSTVSSDESPTGMDSYHEQISIRLVLDKMDDVGASPDIDMTASKLIDLVEGWDDSTNFFKTNSVLYMLRTNVTLGNRVIDNDIDTSYDIQARPNMQLTSEGVVSVTVRSNIAVPFRS